jgi:hypothetical protein
MNIGATQPAIALPDTTLPASAGDMVDRAIGRWRPDEDALRPLLDGLGANLARDPVARISSADGTDLVPVL